MGWRHLARIVHCEGELEGNTTSGERWEWHVVPPLSLAWLHNLWTCRGEPVSGCLSGLARVLVGRTSDNNIQLLQFESRRCLFSDTNSSWHRSGKMKKLVEGSSFIFLFINILYSPSSSSPWRKCRSVNPTPLRRHAWSSSASYSSLSSPH